MAAERVQLACPICSWVVESDQVDTDLAFSVLRTKIVGHLKRSHGLAASDAAVLAGNLRWKHVKRSRKSRAG